MSERRLRVLIYSDHFFPSVGGSENYAFDLALELSRCGLYVGVITSERKSGKDEFPFKIFRLEKPFSMHRINLNFLEIPQIIKSYKPDIFHINYQTGGENILIPLLKIMKLPIVITYHADHVVTLGRILDELQLLSTFRLADTIMVQSERDERKFKMRGIHQGKLRLVRFNGIDTEKYKCTPKLIYDNENIKLLCIARLDDSHKYKGVHELIESIKPLKNKELDFKLSLNIIGDGNLRKPYENECKAANLDNIKFLGDLSFNDLIDQICQASFLILPSVNKAEGFGRVALEALSCGTPVIVSKYAGIAELINKYSAGIVYDPHKFTDFIDNLSSLSGNQQKLQKFIESGKKLITEEGLSLYDVARETVKFYYTHIENK